MNKNHAARFSMNNTHLPVLKEFDMMWPNRIYDKCGLPKNKPQWTVRLGLRTGLREFLEDIMPYLREKEPQAQLCLEALNTPRGDPRKQDIFEELKELKREQGYHL